MEHNDFIVKYITFLIMEKTFALNIKSALILLNSNGLIKAAVGILTGKRKVLLAFTAG